MKPIVTDINQLDLEGTYTVADYLSWQFDELVQLIKGKIVRMSPAPMIVHAQISRRLMRILYQQMPEQSTCQVFDAPVDVYLSRAQQEKPTVLQPDALIFCDPQKVQKNACYGAPDWVCEIVSSGSFKLDTVKKKQVYEEAGVPEYMLIFPGEEVIQVFTLGDDGRYGEPEVLYQQGTEWEISSVPGVNIAYSALFGIEASE